MKLLIVGATGGTGRHLVTQALERGHQVTALVRRPSRAEPRPGLTSAVGDVLDPGSLDRVMQGQEAVLSALGHNLVDEAEWRTALGPGGASIGRLPEQVPYQEWLHSDFKNTQSCQSCHMPAVNEPRAVASEPVSATPAAQRRHGPRRSGTRGRLTK